MIVCFGCATGVCVIRDANVFFARSRVHHVYLCIDILGVLHEHDIPEWKRKNKTTTKP